MQRPQPERRSECRSVHVAVDEVDPAVFGPWFRRLGSAEKDVRLVREIADRIGCSSRVLLGEAAVRDEVLGVLADTVGRLAPGDFLMISFSGHGVRVPGSALETDGLDEAWCVRDGLVLDDDLLDILAGAPEGSDVLVLTDACFAGGMVDEPRAAQRACREGGSPRTSGGDRPDGTEDRAEILAVAGATDIDRLEPRTLSGDMTAARAVLRRLARTSRAGRARRRVPVVRAGILAISASDECQPALEGPDAGLFTAALRTLIDSCEPPRDAPSLVARLSRAMGRQRPCLRSIGGDGAARRLLRACTRAPSAPRETRPAVRS